VSHTSSCALLVMHVQPPLTELIEDPTWLKNVAAAINSARNADVPVIYVNLSYRPGYPELTATDPNRAFLEPGKLLLSGVSDAPHEMVSPLPHEPVVAATRVSAFTHTDLEVLIRAKGIDRLVLAGVSTGGVVLATALAALDRDLAVTVLSDACADPNVLTHRAVVAHLAEGAPWEASVLTVDEWAGNWPRKRAQER
jgi:nicotinamidase-related amidase